MDKLRNLSIRKTIMIYILISLFASFLLWAEVYSVASLVQRQISWKYWYKENNYDMMTIMPYLPERSNGSMMSDGDKLLMEIGDFLITYGFLVFAIPGTVIAVALFYHNKIRIPLRELNFASRRVSENDLDFHITYQNRDELGMLCAEFERMRAELEANNRKMWRMVEEEKILREAIAHDIRTPLATLRGYQEMLLEFLPQGTLSQEKTEEMLREGMEQIDRLSHFVETMRRLSGLEERVAVREQSGIAQLERKIRESARTLEEEYGKSLSVVPIGASADFLADAGLVLEVAENLMSNAMRSANEKVEVRLWLEGDTLTVEVQDDGEGFPRGFVLPEGEYRLQNSGMVQAGQVQQGQYHLGIGLYISRICCEKHGGGLTAENRPEGGAVARAAFRVE